MVSRVLMALGILLGTAWYPALADPMPSWSDGAAKQSIIDFVARVSDPKGKDFVPRAQRVAVFDNDGTLWAEKPFYFQVFFAFDRLAARAEADPSILTSDVLKAAAKGDIKGALAEGKKGLKEIMTASHSGIDIETFKGAARQWLDASQHPRSQRPYNEMIYQPMLELLRYLRDSGFRTYIVSGGGVDFIRSFAEDAYGIPPHQVIGSMGDARYQVVDGRPVIWKDPGIFFVDDKAGKPVAIARQIGVRPIFAAGNSDGDFEMLEWSTAGDGPRFGMLVHHTDAEREWAYDRESHVGRLARGLDEGPKRGWLIVDMKEDWEQVFPWQDK